jgi:hypothetical protein
MVCEVALECDIAMISRSNVRVTFILVAAGIRNI